MLSLEQINVVDGAEVIIAADFLPDQTAAQEANASFRALPAMQRGGYILLPPEMAQALYLESSLSTQWAVPRLVDAVIAGVERQGQAAGRQPPGGAGGAVWRGAAKAEGVLRARAASLLR